MTSQPVVRRTIGVFSLAIAVAAIYAAIWGRFVPSAVMQELALVGAIACGIGGAGFGLVPVQPNEASRTPRLLQKVWVRVPAFALLGYGIAYQAFAAGFPELYTALAGSDGQRVVTVTDWRASNPWSCGGPDIAEAPQLLTPVCLDSSNQSTMPPGTKLKIRGRQSALGIEVSHVERL